MKYEVGIFSIIKVDAENDHDAQTFALEIVRDRATECEVEFVDCLEVN